MQIQIQNIKCKNITYIDNRARKNRNTLRDLKKICIVRLNCNSIDLDVLKANTKYYNVKTEYFKANGRDTLFVDLIGNNHDIIKLFIKYNTILSGLTYKEQAMLNDIRQKSYITKKYNFYDDVSNDEFGIYEPLITVDYYDDYDNIYNQKTFKNKRINYNKNYIKQDVVTKTLERATKTLTEFKASNLKLNYNSDNLMLDIFNIRLKQCSFKLHNNYHRVQDVYDDYDDFIKHMVIYGANHHDNQRFWNIIKRELY